MDREAGLACHVSHILVFDATAKTYTVLNSASIRFSPPRPATAEDLASLVDKELLVHVDADRPGSAEYRTLVAFGGTSLLHKTVDVTCICRTGTMRDSPRDTRHGG